MTRYLAAFEVAVRISTGEHLRFVCIPLQQDGAQTLSLIVACIGRPQGQHLMTYSDQTDEYHFDELQAPLLFLDQESRINGAIRERYADMDATGQVTALA